MFLRPLFGSATLSALVVLGALARPAGAAWPIFPGLNVPLCQAGGGQRYPDAVPDGKGGAIVAWDDQRGGPRDIYAQRVTATGSVRWTWDGVAICSATNEQYEPKLLSDGTGGAIMVWSDYRNGADFDIYAQRVDSSGATKWAANGGAICSATGFQSNPAIVSDGSGGAIIAWDDARSGNTRIYAQRVNSSGAPQWTANGVVLTTQTGGQTRPLVVPSGAGGAIVVWVDYRTGFPDLYGQRVLSTGGLDPAWPAAGRAITAIPGGIYDLEFALVVDGSGGAYVAWDQLNGGTRDVRAQHVLSSSALDPAWPASGVNLAPNAFDQSSPGLLADGAGGVIVAWDDRQVTGRDIHAQHVLVTAAFDPAWPATGSVLCAADGDQEDPRMVTDGAGGAIVTWHDITDIEADLYAQHVKSNGVVDPLWPTDGRAISTAGLRQVEPTMVADGFGGAVLAWEDGRNGTGDFGDSDIFSQGLKANGQLGDEPVGVPGEPSIALALEAQNPARAGALLVRFTLATSADATLELFDVAGRRVLTREVGSLGAGAHAVDLAGSDRRAPGVYFLRLSQQGQGDRRQRVVVLD